MCPLEEAKLLRLHSENKCRQWKNIIVVLVFIKTYSPHHFPFVFVQLVLVFWNRDGWWTRPRCTAQWWCTTPPPGMGTAGWISAKYQPSSHRRWQAVWPLHWKCYIFLDIWHCRCHLMKRVVVTRRIDKLTVTAASK